MLTEEEKQEIRTGSYEYGFEEGMEKGKTEVAGNLLAKGMPVEEVVSVTDLPEEVVRALI